MALAALVLAGCMEAFGVAMINRLSVKKNWQTVCLLIAGFGTSLVLLSYSLRYISMGTGYAVWTGIGVAGGALAGMVFYGEPKDAKRLFFIALILASTIGLKIIS